MGDLIIQSMKRLLTDNLRDNGAFRLVCNRLLVIEHRSVRQVLENHVHNRIQILLPERRCRNDLCKIKHLAVSIDILQDLFPLHGIHLVDN